MKYRAIPVPALMISSAIFLSSSIALGADGESGIFSRLFGPGEAPGVAPVDNPLYLQECGSCHFPYQPGLLPARSWNKLMGGLENHFGENAELPAGDAKALTDYLVRNAADHANFKRSRKIMNALPPGDTPLRVSDTPYFIDKHGQLSREMVQDNPEVVSISRCGVCHTTADKGSFSESAVRIPGFGRWEDKDR